jgi:hypothetical protein
MGCRPCQRDRNRRQLTGGRVVGAGLFRLDRYLDRGNEADFQRLRFDDDAFDMPFEIGFTAPLSHADFAPWASGTSLLQPASPWQNGFAERLIGSIRRECMGHVIVLGEAHLHRILKSYADYYNGVRTHRSLHKDAPVSRPVQRSGVITSHAILGALHHQYVRV